MSLLGDPPRITPPPTSCLVSVIFRNIAGSRGGSVGTGHGSSVNRFRMGKENLLHGAGKRWDVEDAAGMLRGSET